MTKNFELLTFEELLNLPIDIESCFDPIFDPSADFIEEWRKKRTGELVLLHSDPPNRQYLDILETECDGDEPLSCLMRRMIFSDKEVV